MVLTPLEGKGEDVSRGKFLPDGITLQLEVEAVNSNVAVRSR